MAASVNIFTEVRKEESEIQAITQMSADIISTAGKISYNLSLKRRELIWSPLKPKFKSLYTANNEPTELLLGNDLTMNLKDLTVKNKQNHSWIYRIFHFKLYS